MDGSEHSAGGATLGRRAFLGAAAAPLVIPNLAAAKEGGAAPVLITRQQNPGNLEFPFFALKEFLTPNHLFYVRNHFPVPKLDAKTWKLKVEGTVKKPIEIGYDELRKMKAHTVTALLECAGNGRIFLKPPQIGLRWELGGVSNAEWTGVRLADVLERAGVKPAAVEVILEGADKGAVNPPSPSSSGVVPFARSLPLARAKRPEVLLAYKMNGKELTADHGYPVRAVVPAWYGMASVKWLRRLVVTDRPFQGYFQTFQYSLWEKRDGLRTLAPVGELQVKAQLARPGLNELVKAGSTYRVFGAAWAGDSTVRKVEVSTDGGKTWSVAKLLGKDVAFAWRFWEYDWKVPAKKEPVALLARATDARGRTQPKDRDEDRRDGMINHLVPMNVEVV